VGRLSGYAKNPEGLGFGFFLNRTHQFFSMEFLYFDLIILLFIYLFVNFVGGCGGRKWRNQAEFHFHFFNFLLLCSSHAHSTCFLPFSSFNYKLNQRVGLGEKNCEEGENERPVGISGKDPSVWGRRVKRRLNKTCWRKPKKIRAKMSCFI
jgi:hypothetical protein